MDCSAVSWECRSVPAEVYPFLTTNLLRVGNYGKLTLPGVLGVNHWMVIVPLAVALGAFLLWLDRREADAASGSANTGRTIAARKKRR